MIERGICLGCGERMTVRDDATGTHPLQRCYQLRIQKLVSALFDITRVDIQPAMQYETVDDLYAERREINRIARTAIGDFNGDTDENSG